METTSKYAKSFGLAFALCSVLNALLVMAKEKSPSLMSQMQKITGHHWITHSAIIIILFLLFGWLFARIGGGKEKPMAASRTLKIILAGLIAGTLMIFGFYLIAD